MELYRKVLLRAAQATDGETPTTVTVRKVEDLGCYAVVFGSAAMTAVLALCWSRDAAIELAVGWEWNSLDIDRGVEIK